MKIVLKRVSEGAKICHDERNTACHFLRSFGCVNASNHKCISRKVFRKIINSLGGGFYEKSLGDRNADTD